MEFVAQKLWPDADSELLIPQNLAVDTPRPALLVVPGGGYSVVCMDTEGYPVAEHFAQLGFQTFILRYRVAPHRYPEPQQDIGRAVQLLRGHGAAWGIIPDNIAVCGFSAGGHLCLSAGVLSTELPLAANDQFAAVSARPDALLLAYPVVSFGEYGHAGSGQNLLGAAFDTQKMALSLETRITPNCPPTLVWATNTDEIVPVENSLKLFEALRRCQVKSELHIFPEGPHGMQLGYGKLDISQWPQQAKAFLQQTCGFNFPEN